MTEFFIAFTAMLAEIKGLIQYVNENPINASIMVNDIPIQELDLTNFSFTVTTPVA